MDPFRVGLIFFLLLTALRTRAATGMAVPLGLGVIFIAVLLPLTTAKAAPAAGDFATVVAAGVATNTLILSVFLVSWATWTRVR
jgi:uncharacterized membrane protein